MAMLHVHGRPELDSDKLADAHCKPRPYFKYGFSGPAEHSPPMIELNSNEFKLPKGYLILNEDDTYKFLPPGTKWKQTMLETTRVLITLVDYMAMISNIPCDTFQEEDGRHYCRGKVSMAM